MNQSSANPASDNAEVTALRREIALLQEVSRAVNSSLILEDIFEALGDVLTEYIPYDYGAIVVLDDTQNGIKLVVEFDPRLGLAMNPEHHAFAGEEPILVSVLQNPQLYRWSQEDMPAESVITGPNATDLVVVPLVNKGVVVGLLSLSRQQDPGFDETQQHLIQTVAQQIAVAVENAKLYLNTQSQAGRAFLINQLTQAIRKSLDIDVMLQTAVTELGQVTGVSRCTIQYFQEPVDLENDLDAMDPQSVHRQARVFTYTLPGVVPLMSEAEAVEVLPQFYELNVFQRRGVTAQATSLGEDTLPMLNPFVVNDVRDCPEAFCPPPYLQAFQVQSLAIFPILIRQALVGTITLHQCDGIRSWIAEDIQLLQAIAEHLGVALSQARLFQELEHRKRELENALSELQQAQMHLIQTEKMAVLGQFVAGIAHEVNTPLGTITGNTNTLIRGMEKLRALVPASAETPADDGAPKPAGRSPEQLMGTMAELLDINHLACERIAEIVRSLRNFARLDESELKSVDLKEGIESTLILMKGGWHKHIAVEKDYGDDVPLVSCYPGLLNQVFMNLIVNASHAILEKFAGDPEGRGASKQAMARFEGRVTISTRYNADNHTVTVSVSDNGKGISPENQAKIFDPGFTTKGVGVGTGLGLALCFRIVEKHRGEIRVDSTVGEGTTFQVILPVGQVTGTVKN